MRSDHRPIKSILLLLGFCIFIPNICSGKVDSLFQKGLIEVKRLRSDFKYDSAILVLESIEKQCSKEDFLPHKPQALNYLIHLHYAKGDLVEAINLGKELDQYEVTDSTLLSQAYNNLGISYKDLGEYGIALDFFLKSQKIHLAQGKEERLTFDYTNIGGIYSFLEDYQRAKDYLLKAIHIDKTYQKNTLAQDYSILGKIYYNLNEIDLAKTYFDSALTEARKINNRDYIALTSDDVGVLFFDNQQFDSALYYFNQALQLKKHINRESSALFTLNNICDTHIELKDFNNAIGLSKDGFNSAVKLKNHQHLRNFSDNLFQAYQGIGDFKNAVKYHMLYKQYYDSIVNEEKARELMRTQIRFETEQKETENKILKQQDEINRETIRVQNLAIWTVVAGGLIVVIALIVIYRAYRTKKRLSHRINIQREEAIQARDTIQRQSDKLRELDEAKSRFFANISHDLRSPLTLLMGSIEQVIDDKDSFLTNRAEKLLKTGYLNGDRIIHLTNEINELIQLEDGKLVLEKKLIKIDDFLKLITGMFHSAAELKSIPLTYENQLDDPEAIVCIDPQQFEKVMFNLITNAFKHTKPKDSISILLHKQQDNSIQITVRDTGEGIPEHNIPFLFDRYYQSPDTTFKTQEGFGIGLALVQEIVNKHEGKIWVESEVGKGSDFCVMIPIKTQIDEEISTYEDMTYITEKQKLFSDLDNFVTKDRPTVKLPHEASDKKVDKKILIVEDHPEVREYIKDIVEQKYEVLEAIDGGHALKRLEKEDVDLIITDLMMPWFDGFELLERLKDNERLNKIPVLVVSARTTQEDKQKVLTQGVNDFLSKPFNANELLLRIDNLLQRKELWNNNNEDAIFINSKESFDDAEKTLLKKVESLIMDRIGDPALSVLDLADEMAASERQVYRMIKKLTELTPFEYIKEVRWQYAQYLIKNNKVNNPSEAARAIGMNNVSHFNTQFKKRFGRTPAEII